MALEVDAYGPVVDKALSDALGEGAAGTILAHLSRVDPSNGVAGRIRSYLTSPDHFRELLIDGLVDDEAFRTLVDEMGTTAVEPLLHVLADSDSRTVRRRVFDMLAGMGPVVGERAVERLRDGRWFVLRNTLSLLQRLQAVPGGFDPKPFMEHKDPRVRREAFPLALRLPQGRDRVLAAALGDPDERVVRIALLELQGGVSDAVLPTLVNRIVQSKDHPRELRALGVKALTGSRSPLVPRVLLELCTTRRTLFRRPRLAGPAPEVLAALGVLASDWADREEVDRILAQARRSKDVAIRRAVATGGADEGPSQGKGSDS
jgi:HEAT repeat protein